MSGCSTWARNCRSATAAANAVGVPVQQALQHDPAVAHVAVPGQVDPAEAAVGEAADHLVLTADEVARASASARTRTGCGTSGRTPRAGRAARRGPADRGPAVRAGAACARDHRVRSGRRRRRRPAGIVGTCVSPAPSRAPRNRVEVAPSLRVSFDPAWAARAEPSGVDASRLDARDTVDGVLIGSASLVTAGRRRRPTGSRCRRARAEPQTSQSPSTKVPVQPGWLQRAGGSGCRDRPARAAGEPQTSQ